MRADPSDRRIRPRVGRVKRRLFARFVRWLVRRHWLLAVLRRWRPVAALPGNVWLVTRHQDVCEVLDRHGHFAVPYGPKMKALTGTFVLGIDETGHHRRARTVLDRADCRDDPDRTRQSADRVKRRAEGLATTLLDGSGDGIDVVGELTDPIVHAGITEYIGVGAPDAATLLGWCRAIGWDLLLNPEKDPRVVFRGKQAAEEMLELVEACIGERKRLLESDQPPPDAGATLLDRLIVTRDGTRCPQAAPGPAGGQPLDEETVRSNIVGLTVAWGVSVSRAVAFCIDELLRRPELAGAQSAAHAGEDECVARHMFEALRFQPQAPVLARVCRGATLSGDERGQLIPPDAQVLVLAASALMDGHAVQQPRRFRGDRDPRTYHLHFVLGMHACWGEGLATAQMTGIANALLRRPRLRRAPRGAGRLVKEGPFPVRLNVAFDPVGR